MSGGQFSAAGETNGVTELQEEILGPDYNYSAHIKPPQAIGMSGDGNFGALANDIAGLMGYVSVMVTGKCGVLGTCAQTIDSPLGNKFFLETPAMCTDREGNEQKRSIYVNNVPDGSIPFISDAMGIRLPEMGGLLPGVMSNLSQINPMQILTAFVSGPSSTCQLIRMETIDANDVHDVDFGYVTNRDIAVMNDAWFTVQPKPTPAQLVENDTSTSSNDDGGDGDSLDVGDGLDVDDGEGFKNRSDRSSLGASKVDYSRMPNDLFIKIYYSALGLLGIYIFLKMMLRRRK